MATRELYLGGLRRQNADFAMYPANTFSAAALAGIQPFNKEQPVTYFQARDFDFANDPALVRYTLDQAAAGTPIVSADVLGSVIIPADFVAYAFYWKVAAINTGGTFAAGTRVGGVSLVTATTTGTLNSAIVAWPSGPVLFKTPDIIDVTLGTVPAGGIGSLGLIVGVLGWNMRYGNW
jgi:hypothetical protein